MQYSTDRLGKIDVASAAELTVCVAIATYNHARFLAQAIDSILAQNRPVDEIIVVDDGSTDDPGAVTALYPQVQLIRQDNQGLSAARNAALKASKADLILFLDADDRIRPNAIKAGMESLEGSPESVLSYGGFQLINMAGDPIDTPTFMPVGDNAYVSLLSGNLIGMHATVLYRRAMLEEAGGFDITLRRCEDYDAYLRLAQRHPIACYPEVVADYRWHGGNMSRNDADMLRWVLKVHDRQIPATTGDRTLTEARLHGRSRMRQHYVSRLVGKGKPNLLRLVQALKAAPGMTVRTLLRTERS